MAEDSKEFDWFGPEAATFGDRVAGAREVAGMTQNDLARRMGIKIATLRAWEDDRSEPRANKLQMLSGLLNVSLPWLLSGTGIGPDGPAEDVSLPDDVQAAMVEIRAVKTDMTAMADRLGRLEKHLRKMLAVSS
ncbi:MAG: helix-turn-helix transcriptional regulator [Pseudomonadota bacterium]